MQRGWCAKQNVHADHEYEFVGFEEAPAIVRKPITLANLPDWTERHLKLELMCSEF